MTFSANHPDIMEVVHSIIAKKDKFINRFWRTDGNILYFYPVPLGELNDLFNDHGIEWNEVNIAQFIAGMVDFFYNYEKEHIPLDSQIVKLIKQGVNFL